MKPPEKAVYIEWVDSMGIDGWSRVLPDASKRHVTVGWLLEEREDSLVVTSSTGGRTIDNDYSSLSTEEIARCAIIRMQTFKPPKWVMP